MDYTLDFDPKDQIIKISANCVLTQNIRKSILTAVAFHSSNTGYRKVLIDLRNSHFKDDEPMVGALELTTFMRSIGIPPRVKIAFVYKTAEAHRKYFELVANTSGYGIRYFKERDDAVKWLQA